MKTKMKDISEYEEFETIYNRLLKSIGKDEIDAHKEGVEDGYEWAKYEASFEMLRNFVSYEGDDLDNFITERSIHHFITDNMFMDMCFGADTKEQDLRYSDHFDDGFEEGAMIFYNCIVKKINELRKISKDVEKDGSIHHIPVVSVKIGNRIFSGHGERNNFLRQEEEYEDLKRREKMGEEVMHPLDELVYNYKNLQNILFKHRDDPILVGMAVSRIPEEEIERIRNSKTRW